MHAKKTHTVITTWIKLGNVFYCGRSIRLMCIAFLWINDGL